MEFEYNQKNLGERVMTIKLRERQFITLSWTVTGKERTKEIHETNVVQYTFINVGSTVVNVNGIILYPLFSGFQPNQFITSQNMAENDVQVYKYTFEGIPKFVIADYGDPGTTFRYKSVVMMPPLPKLPGFVVFDGLQVVAKIRANKR